MWDKRSSFTLLLGIYINIANMENSTECLKKTNKLKIRSSYTTAEYISKGSEVSILRLHPHSCVMTTLTNTNKWNQLKCPSINEQIMELWSMYIME
jgi:hypothetical protein